MDPMDVDTNSSTNDDSSSSPISSSTEPEPDIAAVNQDEIRHEESILAAHLHAASTFTDHPVTPTVPTQRHQPKSPSFNLLLSLLNYPDLLLYITSQHLAPTDFLALYTTSRAINQHVNANIKHYISASTAAWAALPATSTYYADTTTPTPTLFSIFPFTWYTHLSTTILPASGPRKIPNLRCLFFLHHRASTIRDILLIMGSEGHRLPLPAGGIALAKIWFLLDLRQNASRVALVQNRRYWTDTDILTGLMFCIKLDMHFSHPLDGDTRPTRAHGSTNGILRATLLAKAGLEPLRAALRREAMNSQLSVFQEWLKQRATQPPQPSASGKVFGVPVAEMGREQFESDDAAFHTHRGVPGERQRHWRPQRLIRPDQLLLWESVRRGLRFGDRAVEMMLYGYYDPVTLVNCPMPDPAMVERARKGQ